MQVVCEATQSQSSDVQVAAFECLVRIMQLYYDKMRYYMEKALFGVSIIYWSSLFFSPFTCVVMRLTLFLSSLYLIYV